MLLGVAPASAAPPGDPPLTYRLTVYDRDTTRLAPDGTKVIVTGLPPRHASCAETEVHGGIAELRVEVTENCPAGMSVYFLLLDLPGGGISAASEPPIDWRATAYSESTSTLTATVRPIQPRT